MENQLICNFENDKKDCQLWEDPIKDGILCEYPI